MNKILKLSLIPFSLIISFFISTNFIFAIYAQIFEFNAEDYFATEEKDATTANSNDISSDEDEKAAENWQVLPVQNRVHAKSSSLKNQLI